MPTIPSGVNLLVMAEGDTSSTLMGQLLHATRLPRDLCAIILHLIGPWQDLAVEGTIACNYELFALLSGICVRGRQRPRSRYQVIPWSRPLPTDLSDRAHELAQTDENLVQTLTLDEADPTTNDKFRRRFYHSYGRPLSPEWIALIDAVQSQYRLVPLVLDRIRLILVYRH